MSEINVVAILYPKAGKLERMKELLTNLCQEVHSKEKDTLRYMMTEQIGSKNPSIIMIETYASVDAALKHGATDYFKALFVTMEKEGLNEKAPYIARTLNKAGYDLDRKLLSSKL